MKNYLLLLLFGGCSKNDDDEDNGKVNSSTKRVVDSPYIEYDEKGRWTKALGYKSIVYGTDEIKVVTTGEDEAHFSYEFLLNAKGLVKSYKGYRHYKGNAKLSKEASLEYDDTDHLIAVEERSYAWWSDGYVTVEDRTYTWSDGNIVKIHLSKSSDDIVYKYSSEEYIGDIAEYIENPNFNLNDCSFLVDYGYFGKRCKNLCIQKDRFKANTEIPAEAATQYKYEYTFDELGYVIKVKRRYMHYSNGYQGDPGTRKIEYRNL